MINFAFNHSSDPLKCKDPDSILAFKEGSFMEEYKRLLKVSLEQVKQYQDQFKDDF